MDKSHSIKKYLLLFLGSLSLVLGLIGLLLPVVPTTPFLLLTLFCYLRSSEKLYHWLINHKVFGNYLYNYFYYKAIPKAAKIGTMIIFWCALTVSALLVEVWYMRLILAVIGICVSIHVLTLKTLDETVIVHSDLKDLNNSK